MQNLNPYLWLITLILLTLNCTAFHLFLNHHCYLQNIFLHKNFSYSKIWKEYIMSSISIFENLPIQHLLVQNSGNMNLLNIHEICEICVQTNVQNMFKVKNKGTRIMSDIVLVSLDCQHQKHEYWEPSRTSTMELFLQ